MKKYEFTGATRSWEGRSLHQIRALRPLELSEVRPGDIGGWIEQEDNLSHDDDCWVYPAAIVCGSARVEGLCRIADEAVVDGAARLSGFVLMHHRSHITDRARVEGVAVLTGNSVIYGDAHVAPGEDGPQILPGVEIDFDVAYGQDYAVFGLSTDSGFLAAVSQSGRICVSGTYGRDRWAGDYAGFVAWAGAHLGDEPATRRLLKAIDVWLNS